jgi:hypothetical protein
MPNAYKAMATGATPMITTAETVAVNTPNISYNNAMGSGLSISGTVNVLAGAGVTGITLRVKQGGISGGLLGNPTLNTIPAGNTETLVFDVVDLSNYASAPGSFYTVTALATGATGNSTINQATIEVAAL